ncbi:MAG: hypothetical protein ACE37E_13495 [Hyphomicrobiales bacterium]
MDHQTLVFSGTLDPDAFLAFCAHRADRLSIIHDVLEHSSSRVEVTLRGHATLIDMFEMACSLGPEGSVVVATSRKAA